MIVNDDQLMLKVIDGEELACYCGKPFTGTSNGNFVNGRPLVEENWHNGKKEGVTTYYCGWGTKAKVQINYKEGKRNGLSESWYKDGSKAYEEMHKLNKIVSAVAWKPNGEKCTLTNVKNGNGTLVTFHDNGLKSEEQHFKNGERDGVWVSFYSCGTLKERTTYKHGVKIGV